MLFVTICLATDVVLAEASIGEVQVGFKQHYKVGRWTPISVSLNESLPAGSEVVVETPDAAGNPTTTILSGDGTSEWVGEFFPGRLETTIRVHIRTAAREVVESKVLRSAAARTGEQLPEALPLTAWLVLTLGEPGGFDARISESTGEDDEANATRRRDVRVVHLEGGSEFSETARGLDSVDAIVLAGQYDMPEDRSESVRTWVQNGGHLVIAAGSQVPDYVKSRIAGWVGDAIPVDAAARRVTELTGLENYAGFGKRIATGRRTMAADLSVGVGRSVVSDRNGPLLVQTVYGFGRITFLGLDLDKLPLSEWDSLPRLCSRLLFGQSRGTKNQQAVERRLSQSGVSDIATQVVRSHEDFTTEGAGGISAIRRPSSLSVMAMILLYLMIIGPLDYLLVHRLLKRPRLTWITFPLLVAVGTIFAVTYANAANGSRRQLNQFEMVDVDLSQDGLVRGHAMYSLYSPVARRYAVTPSPKAESKTLLAPIVRWDAVPENVFGGMYRSGGIGLSAAPYEFSPECRSIENLPVARWSTQRMASDWLAETAYECDIRLTSSSAGFLDGTFSHDFPFTISDWILAWQTRVYRPREKDEPTSADSIAPGQVWTPNNPNITSRDLQSFLTGIRSVRTDRGGRVEVEQTDYDRNSTDATYIARILTLHELTGGTSYTGLENAALRRLDLTDIVRLNRAVLFGRIDQPVSHLTVDEEVTEPTRYSGFVRLVLPVKVEKREVLRELPTPSN